MDCHTHELVNAHRLRQCQMVIVSFEDGVLGNLRLIDLFWRLLCIWIAWSNVKVFIMMVKMLLNRSMQQCLCLSNINHCLGNDSLVFLTPTTTAKLVQTVKKPLIVLFWLYDHFLAPSLHVCGLAPIHNFKILSIFRFEMVFFSCSLSVHSRPLLRKGGILCHFKSIHHWRTA